MRFTIYQTSRQGARKYNQDRLAYSYSKDALLLVLADGMGGHGHGELAAQLAIKTLTDAFQRLAQPVLQSPAKFLTDHIQQVHDMIDNLTHEDELIESPRTTIVAAILQRGHLYCAHVGDSRLYHFRKRHLLFRTEDHSVVQSLYRKGLISRDEMENHPYKNKIYNCVGGESPPQIDLSNRIELADGDIILLCSDGVWGPIADTDIKQIMFQGPNISENTAALLDRAEFSAGDTCDNLSAIGLQWGDALSADASVSTMMMPLGETTTIINTVTRQNYAGDDHDSLSDDEIEMTIAEIQAALFKTQKKTKT
jgi:PPM family protein phosphatase